MKNKNFTLIELFVVLGIIAFLFTIILPGLVRAREMAKKSYCLNNICQTVKIVQMYNLDNGGTPYSSTWLVDFSFIEKYVKTAKFGIMECPDTDDSVDSISELNGGTSYHYMGSRHDWENNNEASGDGNVYGFDSSNEAVMGMLSNRLEKLIYDKSDTVHYGTFNVVSVESGAVTSPKWTDRSNYWFVTPAGNLNFNNTDIPNRSHNLNLDRYGNRFDVDVASAEDSGTGGSTGGTTDGDTTGGETSGGASDGDGNGDDGDDGDGNSDGAGEPQPWKVRIIHYPPGNPENAHEICVGYSAWPAHQAHGDTLLEILYK